MWRGLPQVRWRYLETGGFSQQRASLGSLWWLHHQTTTSCCFNLKVHQLHHYHQLLLLSALQSIWVTSLTSVRAKDKIVEMEQSYSLGKKVKEDTSCLITKRPDWEPICGSFQHSGNKFDLNYLNCLNHIPRLSSLTEPNTSENSRY